MLARRRLALAALCATVIPLAVPAASAPARPVAPAATTRATTVASGITTWRQSFRNSHGRTVQSVLMRVRLGRHVTLQARTPGQLIGLDRAPLSSLVRRAHAVAGVNADFFDFFTDAAVPVGAVINGSRVLKSPRTDRLANLYVMPDGRAGIGAIDHSYSLTRAATGDRRAVTHRIFSINSLPDVFTEHLVYLTSADTGGQLDSGCAVVTGTTAGGVSTVTSVGLARYVARPAAGAWALTGCWSTADWLRANLQAGDRITLSLQYPHGLPVVAVSGRRELVRNGVGFNDPTSSPLSTWGPNPETFACVSRDGLTVLLGAIDGRIRSSAGVTYDQLTQYLLRLKCWSAVVFDGGGSTEMVAKLPGHNSLSVLNHPADGSERKIADALVVVTR